MYSFIPQALIILSLAGIIVLVLRRQERVAKFFRATPWTRVPASLSRAAALALLRAAGRGGRWLWTVAVEVKDLSKTSGLSRQNIFAKVRQAGMSLPKPRLHFFKSPDSAAFYLEQAQSHLNEENFADAERQFIKVIELDPKNEQAYAGLGKLYLQQKKFGDAAETYKFLIKHHPENDSYWANLGQVNFGLKLYDAAVEAYEKAIELAPENARRYINLGLVLEAKKHTQEAILNYRRAVDFDKTNTQFLLVLAEALGKTGEKEEAELIFEQILKQEPTNHLAREKLMALKF